MRVYAVWSGIAVERKPQAGRADVCGADHEEHHVPNIEDDVDGLADSGSSCGLPLGVWECVCERQGRGERLVRRGESTVHAQKQTSRTWPKKTVSKHPGIAQH